MKKLFLALIAASIASGAAAYAADEKPKPAKVTNEDALKLAVALRNLDGHAASVKNNGQDAVIMIPWDFGSASLRLRIANDLTIAAAVERSVTEARSATFKELIRKAGVKELAAGTKEREDYEKQDRALLDEAAPGSQDLARIKVSELKLDKNEIAVTVIEALRPILDDDTR